MVITCRAVRAVHFELTVNMGTDNVINAITRFCAIRGTPNSIRTDNAPQFHKADKDVCDWVAMVDWQKVAERTGIGFMNTICGINWLFNPPFAPHFGGSFEIIVKAAKRAMYDVMGKAELTEEEFRTLVYVCADKLNDRPIGLRGDVKDLVTLKPNDFLTSCLGHTYFPPNFPEEKQLDLNERWKYVNLIKGHFCKRFSEEIVPLLRPRKKWTNQKENVSVGDICLEVDENSPRINWRLVKIIKVWPSDDGLIRKVEIESSGGRIFDRPISRLIPIVQD
jgi:hypothetical protein